MHKFYFAVSLNSDSLWAASCADMFCASIFEYLSFFLYALLAKLHNLLGCTHYFIAHIIPTSAFLVPTLAAASLLLSKLVENMFERKKIRSDQVNFVYKYITGVIFRPGQVFFFLLEESSHASLKMQLFCFWDELETTTKKLKRV